MDDSIYTLKRYNKKKKKRSYKLLYLIIIVLSLLICFKKDNTLKDKFKQNNYKENIEINVKDNVE